jgi:class 3 adenylate cyclase/tetratricopeptide (TPR) repeat protein
VQICTSCGQESPDGFRFCGACGAPLDAMPAREERKVVTVLFADLVGFTSRAEQLDPEDVRATLSPYYTRLRTEIERHGGIVEKFIGDAVMALFGAPVAHEDDPERAVRAALAIRDAIREPSETEPGLELQLRIAVTTGEALISLGARPSEGEGMAAGDVVNTAARLQTAAPVNGILVGEATYRATRDTIEYRATNAVEAKGKSEPIPVWEAVAARSRFGIDLEQRRRSILVGRERELGILVDALARCRRELSPQLMTLVGVPGIGKSRLVTELFQVVDRDPDLIWWRQGRSLPYGESLSYWALGEIVKAQAGILETDPMDAAQAKLGAMVDDLLPEAAEREWIEGNLRPLVGVSAGGDAGGDRRSEAFAAWRRLMEALAERRPLVLVFEDLHWADDGLLDFVDHLAEWVTGVAMLIVCTARPELLDRRPGWGGGKRNAATVSISSLSREETAHLLASLLEQILLPAELQERVLAHAEGNPLYAEEYVRMLQDRGFLVRDAHGWRLEDDRELPLPETVQGMIAARLDALAFPEKELIQNAAVIGKVFWPGALAALGGLEPSAFEAALHALERKEFVRRERRSAVAGESAYAFLHALVRDVAYGQIPRAGRVDKHRIAAEWIESLAGDRSEDRAEMLAHHYLEAISLARSAGLNAEPLREPAAAALIEATERAGALNGWAAATEFARAGLELLGDGDPRRARLLLVLGQASWMLGGIEVEPLLEARDAFLAQNEIEAAAEAEIMLSRLFWGRGERDHADEHGEGALALVEGRPLSSSQAHVFAQRARNVFLAGDNRGGLELAERALPMVEQVGQDEVISHVLNTIGMARVCLGDPSGLDDLRRSVALAEATSSPENLHNAYNNLANMHWRLGRLEPASECLRQARLADERFGYAAGLRWLVGEDMLDHSLRGEWDEALVLADAVIAAATVSPHYHEGPARMVRAEILLGRGDANVALVDSESGLALAREAKDAQTVGPGLLFHARVLIGAARPREADDLLVELLRDHDLADPWQHQLPLLLAELGRGREYLAALGDEHPATPWLEAGRAAASGDFWRAAAGYGKIGARAAEAQARLLSAEALIAEGRRAAADAELTRALAYFRSVGATAYTRRGEALLAASA